MIITKEKNVIITVFAVENLTIGKCYKITMEHPGQKWKGQCDAILLETEEEKLSFVTANKGNNPTGHDLSLMGFENIEYVFDDLMKFSVPVECVWGSNKVKVTIKPYNDDNLK